MMLSKFLFASGGGFKANWASFFGSSPEIRQFDGVSNRTITPPPQFSNQMGSVRWSPSGTYLALGVINSPPYLRMFRQIEGYLKPLSSPTGVSISQVYSAAPINDDYVAISGTSSGSQVELLQRTGDAYAKVGEPTETFVSGATSAISWAPNGSYDLGMIAARWSSVGTPLVWGVASSGPTFTPFTVNGGGVSAGQTNGYQTLEWSPNGNFLAVLITNAPRLRVYARTGTTLDPISTPSGIPSVGAFSCAWSSDSQYLAVSFATGDGLRVYRQVAGVFTEISLGSWAPSDAPRGVAWYPGTTLLVAVTADGDLFAWTFSATTPTLQGSISSWGTSSNYIAWKAV